MVRKTEQKRNASVDELRALVALRETPQKYLRALCGCCYVRPVPKGARTRQRGQPQTHLLYLLEGEINLRELDGDIETIQGGTPRANFPIIPQGRNDLDGQFSKASLVLQLPLKTLIKIREKMQRDAQAAAEPSTDEKPAEDLLAERIRTDFAQEMEAEKMSLPGLPDVAARVAGHIDAPESTSGSIARIIQLDPAITARLIQVANSVAYAPRTPIKTCKEAVTRLGRNSTRELITAFVLKGLFRSRSKLINERMQILWQHSTQVAALCHALAHHCEGFEPARAMLIGLVHDIGIIPLLTHAHRYEGLVDNPQALDAIIDRLRGEIGALTLSHWGFADEFIQAAAQAEDWHRENQNDADYTDLLIMAQLHAHLGNTNMQDLPRIDQVPAFRKLALSKLSPRMSLAILDEAESEISAMRALLG